MHRAMRKDVFSIYETVKNQISQQSASLRLCYTKIAPNKNGYFSYFTMKTCCVLIRSDNMFL